MLYYYYYYSRCVLKHFRLQNKFHKTLKNLTYNIDKFD